MAAIVGDTVEITGGERLKVLVVVGTELICFNEQGRSSNDVINVQVVDEAKVTIVV